jgi:histidinol phosphatase-like PHP family hydrolase
MYGSRPGVSADWPSVFAAAARTNVAIEIDGEPARQDIDYLLARDAVKSGCKFALDSDAHDTPEFAYVETAIAHARLAGVPASRVVNCWPLERLLAWAKSCVAPLKTTMLCAYLSGLLRGAHLQVNEGRQGHWGS